MNLPKKCRFFKTRFNLLRALQLTNRLAGNLRVKSSSCVKNLRHSRKNALHSRTQMTTTSSSMKSWTRRSRDKKRVTNNWAPNWNKWVTSRLYSRSRSWSSKRQCRLIHRLRCLATLLLMETCRVSAWRRTSWVIWTLGLIELLVIMSQIFKKVLCVKKTTKFERLQATGLFKSPYVENVLKKTW